jgi:hypothetical protein
MRGIRMSKSYFDDVNEYRVVLIEEHVCESYYSLLKEIKKLQTLSVTHLSALGLSKDGWEYYTAHKRSNEFVVKRKRPATPVK